MTFTAFQAKSQRDLTHPPQWADEGDVTTTTNYGNKGGTDPSFTSIGPGATIQRGSNPVFREIRNSGQQDRSKTVLIRENHVGSISTPITDNNIELVKSAMNKAGGDGTADESKVFLKGYKIKNTQYYEVYSGSVWSRGRIVLDPEGFWTFEGEFTCKEIYQDTAHGLTGTPVITTAENSDTPWTGSDAGDNSLEIDSVNYADFGMSIDVVWEHSILRPSESKQIVWMKPTKRSISGNIDIFVSDDELDNDSVKGTSITTVKKIMKESKTTITIEDLVFNGAEGSDDNPENAGADVKSKGFTCNHLTIS